MARATKAAPVKEPKRRGREPLALTDYKALPPTNLQARFVGWIQDKVGYEPTKAKTKAEAFAEGVRLAVALRMPFQASDENQKVLAQRRAEKNGGAAKKAEETPRKTRKKAASEVEAEETPKKKAKKAKAAVEAEEKPAKKKPGRPPKAKAETEAEKPAKKKSKKAKAEAEEPAAPKAKVKRVKAKAKREAPSAPAPDLDEAPDDDEDVPF